MHENTPEATKGLRKYFVSNPRQGNQLFGELLGLEVYCLVKEKKAADPEAECTANW